MRVASCTPHWVRLSLASVVALCALLTASDSAATSPRVFAVIVGVNQSDVKGVAPLRYADDDAARYFELFSAAAERVELLTRLDSSSAQLYARASKRALPPTRAGLLAALTRVRSAVAKARAGGDEVDLFFVYGGHGHVDKAGRGFVSLQGGRLTRRDLYKLIVRGTKATRVHLIIDACHAKHLVGARGGPSAKRGWRPDRVGLHLESRFKSFLARERYRDYPHLGVLLSSSSDGKTHEWSRLRAGVFSHEVRSGLLGAADVNGDAVVSYAEMHAFLAAANKKVRHAKARIRAFVRAPSAKRRVKLLRWGARPPRRCRLDLGPTDRGRLTIEDGRGLPYADLNKAAGGLLRIVLLEERSGTKVTPYWVRRGGEIAALRPPSGCTTVRLSSLKFSPSDRNATRGSADDALRAGLFAVAFGEAFYQGFVSAVDFARLPVLDAPTPSEPARPLRPWGYAAGGLAAAAAITAGVLAGLAVRDSGELDDRIATKVVLSAEDRALADRATRLRTAAIVVGGVGLAATAATIYLLWPRATKKRGRARVTPLLVAGGAGLSVGFSLP